MSRCILILLFGFQPSIFTSYCIGQGQIIQWRFESVPLPNGEFLLTASAKIAPGWHLYSQYLEANGPIPTRVQFEKNNDFELVGRTEEKGNPVTYYDSIYEMQITWYTNQVSFHQRIRAFRPAIKILGSIEFMVCNDHMCIPDMRGFSFNLSPNKKTP